MTDRPLSPDPLEAELVALGRSLVVDAPPPDLAQRVIARLTTAEVGAAPTGASAWTRRMTRFGGRRRLVAAAAAAATVLLVALVPPVRAAVMDLLRIGGVTVRQVPDPRNAPTTSIGPDGSGTMTPSSPTGPPEVTAVASLEVASRRMGFDIAVPPSLGSPTTIVLARRSRVVEVTWGTGPTSTRLDVFDGSLSFGYLKSVWNAVTPTNVAGQEAVWLATPHLIEWTDRSGATVSSPPRVAGPTLVWLERDRTGREITYRLEGPATLDAAKALAESAR